MTQQSLRPDQSTVPFPPMFGSIREALTCEMHRPDFTRDYTQSLQKYQYITSFAYRIIDSYFAIS